MKLGKKRIRNREVVWAGIAAALAFYLWQKKEKAQQAAIAQAHVYRSTGVYL